jgi:hypothetical protein
MFKTTAVPLPDLVPYLMVIFDVTDGAVVDVDDTGDSPTYAFHVHTSNRLSLPVRGHIQV